MVTDIQQATEMVRQAKRELILSVKNGTHKQFLFSKKNDRVECKCGQAAVVFGNGYMCRTITAYPCKYN